MQIAARALKTLQLYLIRQVVTSLLMTVAVFTAVFLLGNVLNEVLALLVKGEVPLRTVLEAVGLLVPFVMVFALPMALLASTLLVFGRFSADQELTAARAGGISLVALVAPILLLSLALCGFSAYVNLEFAPRCRVAYKDLFFKLGAQFVGAQLPEGRVIKSFPGFLVYIGRNDRGALKDVLVMQRESTNATVTFRAATGTYFVDETNRQVVVELSKVTGFFTADQQSRPTYLARYTLPLPFGESSSGSRKPPISDLTFAELRAQLRELESDLAVGMPPERLTKEQFQKQRAGVRKQLKDLESPLRVQLHRQVAFSFACFGFTMIGIPLGIRVHRRETNISFAIAMVLVLVYYSFLMVAQSLATRPEFAPHLIVWLPNFLFQVVGGVLLWRANRGL